MTALTSMQLRLPAHYREIDIAHLSEGINAASFTAFREHHHQSSDWIVDWMFQTQPDIERFKAQIFLNAALHALSLPEPLDLEIKDIADRDWLTHSYQQFPALEIGPFYIYGAHETPSAPDSSYALQIDATTAFGSGDHGTTAGCLLTMDALKNQGVCPWNILDMGTGSGILAIAAWKLWKAPVLAVDNDAEAVRVTKRHAEANAVPLSSGNLFAAHGDGFAAEIVKEKAPYELIVANILAGPLKDMAADLVSVLDENGYVILSGILDEQADDVIAAYMAQGLALRDHTHLKGWSTLMLQK